MNDVNVESLRLIFADQKELLDSFRKVLNQRLANHYEPLSGKYFTLNNADVETLKDIARISAVIEDATRDLEHTAHLLDEATKYKIN